MAKIPRISYKQLFTTFGPALGLVIIGFWVASKFISPAPPRTITITTGSENGGYYHYAKLYKEELEKQGIELKIITSSGSRENLQRLSDNEADIAFVQGGITAPDEDFLSLGSLYYEPIWIFLNNNVKTDKLAELKGLRINAGAEGSGTREIADVLLQINQIDQQNSEILSLPSAEAAELISSGQIDVAFFVSATDSPLITHLLNDPKVHLLSIRRADAYSHLLPYLSRVVLAEGIINMHENIPDQPINLIAPTATVVFKEELHSAIQVLLMQAVFKIHSQAGILIQPGDFPSTKNTTFPLSDVAERYFEVGAPFLMRYLPFWAAIFIDRTIVMLIPLLALLFPLIKIMPPVYRWRIRSSIYRWYKELQIVDNETFESKLTEEKKAELLKEIRRIQEEVNKIQTPLSYADQVYNLLLHIDLVKKKIAG